METYFLGGPYSAFAGRDASRGLATFSVTSSEKEYDDLSDLNSMEMESVREWEMQFKGILIHFTKLLSNFGAYRFIFISPEKYELVGRLLKPGESPANYSEEEEENVKSKED